MDRRKLAVVFGGCSEEHPVSVKSAREIARVLDTGTYEPYYLGITASGAWRLCEGPDPGWDQGSGRAAVLSPDRAVHGLLVAGPDGWEQVRLDAVLPVLHGRYGEDGAIQGLLELSGIPYVGCDIQSSALCMDKSLAYLIARAAGIATPEFETVAAHEELDPARFTYPVFVKPARSGSSFGVGKVGRGEDLTDTVKAAGQYDGKVLIEQAVTGREVGCAVLGDGADLLVGEIDEVSLTGGFFRIHQEQEPESGSENARFIVPADIRARSRALVQESAKRLYRALGCRGIARVDLFLTPEGGIVLNEVNTFPGMTSYSRYPRMMAAAGLALAEVVDRLVALALAGGGDER